MKFLPSLKNHSKSQKGRLSLHINNCTSFYNFFRKKTCFLKTMNFARISYIQLQAFYKILKKFLKRSGKIKFKVFSHTPVTKKPVETRMGKGKGSISSWVVKLKAGSVLCEISANNILKIKKSLYYLNMKLPIKLILF
jgi:large subunit ribosomal protein L16